MSRLLIACCFSVYFLSFGLTISTERSRSCNSCHPGTVRRWCKIYHCRQVTTANTSKFRDQQCKIGRL
ncbi:hypothetical protein Mapa_005524 [Marchantia paleacea]|nr:hypothetical protein Mapa_005524 [Marchantia paleacea]